MKTNEPTFEIPIVEQAKYFLAEAGSVNGIKLTEKGALGRAFVQGFWDTLLDDPDEHPFRPNREFDCPETTRMHVLLTETNYVRKFKGTIRLTPKGNRFCESLTEAELYRDLLKAGMYSWNWGFEDRYPEFVFIQNSAPVLLQALCKWPSDVVTPIDLFNSVYEPIERPEAADGLSSGDLLLIEDPEIRCFTVRFFHRFCIPFGILVGETSFGLNWKNDDKFLRTKFFKNIKV